MEVATNICIGLLDTRSQFQQILVQLTNSRLINCMCPAVFVDNVILALLKFLEYINKRRINEFASEIATGNLISMHVQTELAF